MPLQSLWRAVCEKRTPRGQDRGWFLSAFCGRAAGDELEFLYAHSDIRPHLSAGLPTPAAALLLLLARDSQPTLQRAAPAAKFEARGATHYLYAGGDATRVGLATLTAELGAAAAACRQLQRAAARDGDAAAAAAQAAATDAATEAAHVARRRNGAGGGARNGARGGARSGARGGGSDVLRRGGTPGGANAAHGGGGRRGGGGGAGAGRAVEPTAAALGRLELLLQHAATAAKGLEANAAAAQQALTLARGQAAAAAEAAAERLAQWEEGAQAAAAAAGQAQQRLQRHAEALLAAADERRGAVHAKRAELRRVSAAAGRLLTAQSGQPGLLGGPTAFHELATPYHEPRPIGAVAAVRAELSAAELEFSQLVAHASTATQQVRAATAERDARCNELRVKWAGRSAARRSGQAAAAAAAAADGVEPVVRAAFGAHLKRGAAALGVRELRAALRDAGLACTSDDAIATMARFDANGDGKLDLVEFAALVAECRGHEQRHAAAARAAANEQLLTPQVRAAFAQFDSDGDGGLGAREVRVALRTLGLPEATADDAIATLLHKYDADADGRLDLGEFGLLVFELSKYQAEQAARQADRLLWPHVLSHTSIMALLTMALLTVALHTMAGGAARVRGGASGLCTLRHRPLGRALRTRARRRARPPRCLGRLGGGNRATPEV